MNSITDKPFAGARKGSRLDPFATYSNFIYPRTVSEALIYAEWFWSRFANYRTSIMKLVSYFVSGYTVVQTDTDRNDVDPDAVQRFEELLETAYNTQSDILQFGIELAAMGNVFVSADPVFSRQLYCTEKGCGWIANLKKLRKGVDYEWDGKSFRGTCPHCGKKVAFGIKDVAATGPNGEKVRFIYRSPRDMQLQFNQLTGTCKYYYKLPAHIKQGILRGDAVYLEDSPRVFLEAASTNDLIEFPEDKFFAMRTHTLSCLDRLYMGWGVPLFMASFNDYIRLQHLDKFNEAVAMDYIAPLRMLSPAPGNLRAGTDDPNRMTMSGAQFRTFMQDAVKRVRENPTTWLVSPVPVQYTMLGGEAKNLAPVEMMDWESMQCLANQGIPQEFKQTTFQAVAPSMGLRMFERQHIQFNKDLNAYTRWKAAKIADAHRIENMDCTLDTTSFVEDDMNKQVLTQMMQGGFISKTNVLKRYNVDFEDDVRQRMKEQQQEAEIAMKSQLDQQGGEMLASVLPPPGSTGIGQAQMNIQMMQQAAQGGAPAQPGMPAQPAGGAMPAMPFNQGQSESASLEQLTAQAQDMAQRLYNADPATRRRELVNLKQTNPTLHAAVKQMLADQKQQVASDAVAQSQMPQQ